MKVKDLMERCYYDQNITVTQKEKIVFNGTATQLYNKGGKLLNAEVDIFYGSAKKITIEVS